MLGVWMALLDYMANTPHFVDEEEKKPKMVQRVILFVSR